MSSVLKNLKCANDTNRNCHRRPASHFAKYTNIHNIKNIEIYQFSNAQIIKDLQLYKFLHQLDGEFCLQICSSANICFTKLCFDKNLLTDLQEPKKSGINNFEAVSSWDTNVGSLNKLSTDLWQLPLFSPSKLQRIPKLLLRNIFVKFWHISRFSQTVHSMQRR